MGAESRLLKSPIKLASNEARRLARRPAEIRGKDLGRVRAQGSRGLCFTFHGVIIRIYNICIYMYKFDEVKKMTQPAAGTYTYGLPDAAQAVAMNGREMLQAIIDGTLPQPPIAETMTFWLTEVDEGFAAFEGEPGTHLLNPMGTVHGGWALTLIDSA